MHIAIRHLGKMEDGRTEVHSPPKEMQHFRTFGSGTQCPQDGIGNPLEAECCCKGFGKVIAR